MNQTDLLDNGTMNESSSVFSIFETLLKHLRMLKKDIQFLLPSKKLKNHLLSDFPILNCLGS